jgi:hypothetical protein
MLILHDVCLAMEEHADVSRELEATDAHREGAGMTSRTRRISVPSAALVRRRRRRRRREAYANRRTSWTPLICAH